ncbi:coenzyme Q-binding protein COQ10, mitochondrial isoform X2 [Condylostylus longicornis]|uniref:coenzyme Q-binding protein COQ10, mitochondrial isoform X2 n=1 Tax=Condylostylus longicornis TaxID=2530218 RepID=UPI00244DAAEA|nr:coenzyme Q-binding protein COQ10, mitochondrial isoform X2 [Condylostylus longicornis]
MYKTVNIKLFKHLLHNRKLSTGPRNISNSIFSINFTSRRREYIKKEIIGVVSDVENYVKFVPYVKKSNVHSFNLEKNNYKADLIVGFSPLTESYTSNVKIVPPSLVIAECDDGHLFKYLKNEWRFSPGLRDIPQSCVIDFIVLFEFKNVFHSQIANLFFDIICDQMEHAFHNEVQKRYGDPSIRNVILSSKKT